MKILDLGCGNAKEEGALGIDYRAQPGVDIVYDLDNYPWPLESDSFDLVVCKHIIEHLNNVVRTMEEIHRILKKGGIVKIYTPHFSNVMSFKDPTHRWHFTFESFDYFVEGLKEDEVPYTNVSFELINKHLIFSNSPLTPLAKLGSKVSMKIYERNFCRAFPAKELYVEMKAKK